MIEFWIPLALWGFAPLSLYLRYFHRARLRRGAAHRWLVRRLGSEFHLLAVDLFLILLVLGSLFVQATLPSAIYWTITVVIDVIDFITGGDDPGKRLRKWVSDKIKKLKIKPAPRPVLGT